MLGGVNAEYQYYLGSSQSKSMPCLYQKSTTVFMSSDLVVFVCFSACLGRISVVVLVVENTLSLRHEMKDTTKAAGKFVHKHTLIPSLNSQYLYSCLFWLHTSSCLTQYTEKLPLFINLPEANCFLQATSPKSVGRWRMSRLTSRRNAVPAANLTQ